jgi:hypothetical protein
LVWTKIQLIQISAWVQIVKERLVTDQTANVVEESEPVKRPMLSASRLGPADA